MDAWIAECEEAWQLILQSYCLDGDIESLRYGCDYGHGNTHDHFDFHAVNQINDYADILSAGQDLEIGGIDDIEGIIQKSVDLTQKGVNEFLVKQKESVQQAQSEIQTEIVQARDTLKK